MSNKSIFDIIGPVMIGPSSSHTAGAVRIGLVARKIFGIEPKEIEITFYSSFAKTYKGHCTDVAVIGGILNFGTDDRRIKNSLKIAEQKNIKTDFIKSEDYSEHPNTVKIVLTNGKNSLEVVGVSVGGGSINIIKLDGFKINFSSDYPTLFVLHKDVFGTVSSVTSVLAEYEVNISYMVMSRLTKGDRALMVVETDQKIIYDLVKKIESKPNIQRVIKFDTI